MRGHKRLSNKVFVTIMSVGCVSLPLGASATPGSYPVQVLQLPSAQTLAATGVADPAAPIGQGTLTFDFGRIRGGTLDADTGYLLAPMARGVRCAPPSSATVPRHGPKTLSYSNR